MSHWEAMVAKLYQADHKDDLIVGKLVDAGDDDDYADDTAGGEE